MPSEEEGEDQLARQVSGNPYSPSNSARKGQDDPNEWSLGGGLFNNLNQLDDDTRKKINEEYTRQEDSSTDK